MRYYLDTEFIEDGKTIELISIGIVAEDGRELYLCNSVVDMGRANDWVKQHVIPQLPPIHPWTEPLWKAPHEIAECVKAFVTGEGIEFWAYYADYDWVLFCQLFGRMVNLPAGFPMMCMDLHQLALDWGCCMPGESLKDRVPQETGEHDALEDARWNARAHEWLFRQAAAKVGDVVLTIGGES